MESNVMLKVSELTKSYKNIKALDNVNLSVSQGKVIGLLGKNGAGKSTLNKLITELIFPDYGSISLRSDVKIGFLSENLAVYPNLTASENLEVIALQEDKRLQSKEIESILDMVSLENTKKLAKGFSLGMKRRLQIAMTLLSVERNMLILDEPTNGLDLDGVLWLKKLIEQFKKEGKTIFLASHAIEQMQDILTDYIILHKGEIVHQGKVGIDNNQILAIHLRQSDFQKASQLLRNKILYQSDVEGVLKISNRDNTDKVLQFLGEDEIFPLSFYQERVSLIDKFQRYTGNN